jgi:hypothetical protein
MTVDPRTAADPRSFNQMCRFERRAVASNGYGGERGDWAAIDGLTALRGRLSFKAAREAAGAGAPEAIGMADLQIPRSVLTETITATDRVIIAGQTWRIAGAPQASPPGGGLLRLTLSRVDGG